MATDELYYIMDYCGNYYRTDNANQLIAAKNKDEATVFTFVQANSRIRTGKKASFFCMVPVRNEERDFRTSFTKCVQEIVSEMVPDSVESEEPETLHASRVKELVYGERQEPVEKNGYSYNLAEIDWTEYLTHFTFVAEGIKNYQDELKKNLSDVDQKICDILHYIELCETDDDEAVDLVELLRVCRENRREIKDELTRTECFQTNLGTSAIVAKAKQTLKSVKGLETRKYTPRKYNELFENCVMKDRRREKEDLEEPVTEPEGYRVNYSIERTVREESGEDKMNGEKYETPFDNTKNDWLAFARAQAEFYQNAGQYISNLQIRIREIDAEIEDVLEETEDANCNVAQGYKVFKILKELRLERKAKSEELNCLYALTDYIDCEAMADAARDNLAEVESILHVEKDEVSTMVTMEARTEKAELEETELVQDLVG